MYEYRINLGVREPKHAVRDGGPQGCRSEADDVATM